MNKNLKYNIYVGKNSAKYKCALWREVAYEGLLLYKNVEQFTIELELNAVNNDGGALFGIRFSNVKLDGKSQVWSFFGPLIKKLIGVPNKLELEVGGNGSIKRISNMHELSAKWGQLKEELPEIETFNQWEESERGEFVKYGNLQFSGSKSIASELDNSFLFRAIFEKIYNQSLEEGVPVILPKRKIESILFENQKFEMDFEFKLMDEDLQNKTARVIVVGDLDVDSVNADELEDLYYKTYEGIDDFEEYTFDYTAQYIIDQSSGLINEAEIVLHEDFNNEKLKGDISFTMRRI